MAFENVRLDPSIDEELKVKSPNENRIHRLGTIAPHEKGGREWNSRNRKLKDTTKKLSKGK